MFVLRGRNSLQKTKQLAQVRGRNSPEDETSSPRMGPNETQSPSPASATIAAASSATTL